MKLIVVLVICVFALVYSQKCDYNSTCPEGKVCGVLEECVDVDLLVGKLSNFKKDECTTCADRCVNAACPFGFRCTSDDWCCKECKKE